MNNIARLLAAGLLFPTSCSHATTLQQAAVAAFQYDAGLQSGQKVQVADKQKRWQGRAGMLPQVGIDGSWSYLTAWKKGDAIASTADAQLILVLDEATSHLDVNNESLINAEIKKMQNAPVIVAHRPETIRSANRVILLQNGQPTELQPDPFLHQA